MQTSCMQRVAYRVLYYFLRRFKASGSSLIKRTFQSWPQYILHARRIASIDEALQGFGFHHSLKEHVQREAILHSSLLQEVITKAQHLSTFNQAYQFGMLTNALKSSLTQTPLKARGNNNQKRIAPLIA